jgi:hypothetical protein
MSRSPVRPMKRMIAGVAIGRDATSPRPCWKRRPWRPVWPRWTQSVLRSGPKVSRAKTMKMKRPHSAGYSYLVATLARLGPRDCRFDSEIISHWSIGQGAPSESIGDARESLGRYFAFYNSKRRYQSLDRWTPDSVSYQDVVREAA